MFDGPSLDGGIDSYDSDQKMLLHVNNPSENHPQILAGATKMTAAAWVNHSSGSSARGTIVNQYMSKFGSGNDGESDRNHRYSIRCVRGGN